MSNNLKFYINGEWVAPAKPATIDVINPATEEAFTQISMGSADDVNKAVAAAKAAFPKFSQTSKADRVALLKVWPMAAMLLHLNSLPPAFAVAALNPFGLTARALAVAKGVDGMAPFNAEEVRRVEMPAANGTGTARSVAALYGSAATGGTEIGLSPAVLAELGSAAVPPSRGVRDKVLRVDTSFSLGFCKPAPFCLFGSSDNAFGTPGAGGSFGFADPDTGVGFAYVMNKAGFHLASDPRELALRQALFRDVLGERVQV